MAAKKSAAKKRTRRAPKKTAVVVMANPSAKKRKRKARRNPSHYAGHAMNNPRRRRRKTRRNPSTMFHLVSGVAGAAAGYVAAMLADQTSMTPKNLAYLKVGGGLVGGGIVAYLGLPAAGAGWALGAGIPGVVSLYKGASDGKTSALVTSEASKQLAQSTLMRDSMKARLGEVYDTELQLGEVYSEPSPVTFESVDAQGDLGAVYAMEQSYADDVGAMDADY